MSTHLSRVEWREGEGEKEEGGREEGRTGEAPFVLFIDTFLFSFLLPFGRRVKTK